MPSASQAELRAECWRLVAEEREICLSIGWPVYPPEVARPIRQRCDSGIDRTQRVDPAGNPHGG
jgi:hypothetical protein